MTVEENQTSKGDSTSVHFSNNSLNSFNVVSSACL